MNIDDIKSNWKNTSSPKKSKNELLMMTKIKNHPKLNRIRIKLIIETVLLIIFISIYYNAFDGSEKPLWANITLISAAVLFILNDFIGWLSLRNPIKQNNLRESLANFHLRLKRLSILSVITSFLFGSSVILFFSSTVDFSNGKYFILGGMIITMIVLLYLSIINWNKRIAQIREVVGEFDDRA